MVLAPVTAAALLAAAILCAAGAWPTLWVSRSSGLLAVSLVVLARLIAGS